MLDGIVHRVMVPMHSKAHDERGSFVGHETLVAELFAGVCVADMQFNERDVDADKSIAEGDAGMRIRARVDDDGVYLPTSGVDSIDNATLVVGLKDLKLSAEG